MLVNRRMSTPVITVSPDMSVTDCLKLMQQERIRRTPVVDENGRLVGIVSDKDLLNASPSDATSLSIWEINYLVSRIRIKDVMTKDVLTITEDMPIEEAARIMVDNKVGGLPVVKNGDVIGLITETDLFKMLLELMGARDQGVRVTAVVPEKIGVLAKITQAVANADGSFLAFGEFSGDAASNRIVTFKVRRLDEAKVRAVVEPVVDEIIDIRTV
ncbi:MAG: CBS domain-containing protein [Ardenticatenaceae bacterium]|nr:CBS domain-containing protein [Anaerolineales bacterium]MCB8940629.1 CBS domain-containing protein [Ardenticatenaceae bacterium]MCB8971959.1 CBS domain-containing protein [Ardenticatenaceae bacterium]